MVIQGGDILGYLRIWIFWTWDQCNMVMQGYPGIPQDIWGISDMGTVQYEYAVICWDISGYLRISIVSGTIRIWDQWLLSAGYPGISQDIHSYWGILDMGSMEYGHVGISWDTPGYLGHFGHGNSAI